MSVSVPGRDGGHLTSTTHEPGIARIFLWLTSLLVLIVAIPGAQRLLGDGSPVLQLGFWAGVVAAVDLMPIRVWGTVSVSMSFPVTLAAGMIFLPTEAALIAFLGSFDPRELRGQVSLAKSVFNRSQVAGSVMAGSAVFHGLGGDVMDWPSVVLPATLAILSDAGLNALLVAGAISLQDQLRPSEVLERMFGSSPWHYVAGYLLLGLLAIPLAPAVAVGGVWPLVLCLAPLTLAREMFRQAQRALRAAEEIQRKDSALLDGTKTAVRERKDERLTLAGELHDEVLPSLFKIHLMGQVLKQDLASGRLLALDQDLPELLSATEEAQRGVRTLLGDLRTSPIGAGGLLPTLRLLADQLRAAGAPPIRLDVEEVEATPLIQLLIYQLVREALHNSAKHAKASRIVVRLSCDGDLIRVSVNDDGVGFDAQLVDRNWHFGLEIMRERLEAAGGRVFVDTQLGDGTTVAASLPRETRPT